MDDFRDLRVDDTTDDVGQHRIEDVGRWAMFKDRVERMTDGSFFDVGVGVVIGVIVCVAAYAFWVAFDVFYGRAL